MHFMAIVLEDGRFPKGIKKVSPDSKSDATLQKQEL